MFTVVAVAAHARCHSNGVALGDVDGDDNLDAVFALFRQSNLVCHGKGDGTFDCTDLSADTRDGKDIALADLDGDEALDIVVGNAVPFGGGDAANQIFLNNNDGKGRAATFTATDIADTDGDDAFGVAAAPAPDVGTTTTTTTAPPPSSSTTAPPPSSSTSSTTTPSGTTTSTTTLPPPAGGGGGLSPDQPPVLPVGLVGDNRAERVVAVFANRGHNDVCDDASGSFRCSNIQETTHTTAPPSASSRSTADDVNLIDARDHETNDSEDVALGDMTGDGILDAIFANRGEDNRLCVGKEDGTFTCLSIFDATPDSVGVALGDVDGNGVLDAVFANLTGNGEACFNTSAETTFVSMPCRDIPDSGGSSNSSRAVALGDVNEDGNLDAVFANFQESRFCEGDGTGSFDCSNTVEKSQRHSTTCSTLGCPEREETDVALGDVNGDGKLDAVFAGRPTDLVCLGNGLGDFNCDDVTAITSDHTHAVGLGDVNGDGNLDAVFAARGANRVCIGDGEGGFTCSDIDGSGTDGEKPAGVLHLRCGTGRRGRRREPRRRVLRPQQCYRPKPVLCRRR